MEPKAHTGARWRARRFLAWTALLLLALPLLTFGASNLLLASPWVLSHVEARIEAASGLETSVSNISWSPWNGATARRIECLQPAPLRGEIRESLVQIESVRVYPVWSAWLRGRPEILSVRITSPRIVLPVEVLAHLSGGQTAAAPPVAAAPVEAPEPAPVAEPEKPAPPPGPVAESRRTQEPSTAAAVPSPLKPTGWVHLENASFDLVSTGRSEPLFRISGIDGGVPVSGNAAKSTLRSSLIEVLETAVSGAATARLSWEPPFLELQAEEEVMGMKIKLAGRIGRLSGFPLQIGARLVPQPLEATILPGGITASAATITANARFGGLLLVPATWQADWVGEATAPALKLGTEATAFDAGRIVTVLRNGTISCVDARLTSDSLSFLGNAALLADGRFAAVLRTVAPAGATEATARRLFPAVGDSLSLTPLSTPQRVAFDAEAFGTLSRPFLRLGRGGPVIDLTTQSPAP